MECKFQVEIDDYATKVLEKHWPYVRRWRDVRNFPPPFRSPREWYVDVICGGFPCQDISASNYRGRGLQGDRSGLWFAFERVIRTLRPRFVVIENVTAITFRGLDRVLIDLAASGYDAEWNTLSCRQFGGPHQRDRIFIVAYAASERLNANGIFNRSAQKTTSQEQASRIRLWPGLLESSSALPDRFRWCPDRKLCRMVDEFPDELDRYKGLGNAVLPQVAKWIGRQIIENLTKQARI